MFARANLESERGELDLCIQVLKEFDKRQEDKLRDRLVFVSGHRQHLHKAIGELDQPVGLVGKANVLLIGPEALEDTKVNIGVFAAHPQRHLKCMRIDRHKLYPCCESRSLQYNASIWHVAYEYFDESIV